MGSFCDHPRFPELITRILCDVRPPYEPTHNYSDASYLFGQTSDNESSVFTGALKLMKYGMTGLIALCDGETNHGYPGFNAWRQKLIDLGIKESDIVAITQPPGQNVNTLTEATALVNIVRNLGWRNIFIVSTPFHQLRAFVTVVSVIKGDASLKIYNYIGDALPWQMQVRHSQGTTVGKRHKLLQGELERLNQYREKGDLISLDQVLEYLDRRDS